MADLPEVERVVDRVCDCAGPPDGVHGDQVVDLEYSNEPLNVRTHEKEGGISTDAAGRHNGHDLAGFEAKLPPQPAC